MKERYVIWELIDDYCKQYRGGAASFVLYIISSNFNFVIVCMIGSTRYGKNIIDVDGLRCMIDILAVDDG